MVLSTNQNWILVFNGKNNSIICEFIFNFSNFKWFIKNVGMQNVLKQIDYDL